MQYILDTAHMDSIKHFIEFYPVAGVTTNPTIISRERSDFGALVKGIRNLIGDEKMLHVQVTGTTAEEMIEEAIALKEYVGGNFYVKIPAIADGFKAMMALHKMGMKITATAIFTQQQALISARAGADFVAPYVSRLDNLTSDGVQVVADIVQMFNNYHIDTQVLAASFKTAEQVHKIALAGCHAVTINPDLFNTLTYHPMTNYAIDDFNADWENAYGRDKILDLLK